MRLSKSWSCGNGAKSIDEELPWYRLCFVFFHCLSQHECGVPPRDGNGSCSPCQRSRRASGGVTPPPSTPPLCQDWEGPQLGERLSWRRHLRTGNGAGDSPSSALWGSISKAACIFPVTSHPRTGRVNAHHSLPNDQRYRRRGAELQPSTSRLADLSARRPGAGEKKNPCPRAPCPALQPRGGSWPPPACQTPLPNQEW